MASKKRRRKRVSDREDLVSAFAAVLGPHSAMLEARLDAGLHALGSHLRAEMAEINAEISRLRRRMSRGFRVVREDIRDVRVRLERLERSAVGVGRVVALERRVRDLEGRR